MMWNALFAFENLSNAERATRTLVELGLPVERFKIHQRASGPPGGVADAVDEQVTGGLLTNLYNLFQGVFDWGSSPHDAAAYEAVVNRGGGVLDVEAQEPIERDRIDRALDMLTSTRTAWREVH